MTVGGSSLEVPTPTAKQRLYTRLAQIDPPIEFEFAENHMLAIRQNAWAETDQADQAVSYLKDHVAGRIFVRDEVYVLFSAVPNTTAVPKRSVAQRLTQRELKIGCMIADGLTDKEIARKLGISAHTVREHCRRACAKLNISKRSALVRRLFAAGRSG